MSPRSSLLVLAGPVLTLLCACLPTVPVAAPSAAIPPAQPTTRPVLAVPTTTPLPPPSMPPAAPVDYQRSGGFAGFDDHLTVDAQGHAVLTRRRGKFEFDLSRDEMTQLQAALRDADLASIPPKSDKRPVPDQFSYVLSYLGHTVRTSDSALPQRLAPAISLLNNIIDTKGK